MIKIAKENKYITAEDLNAKVNTPDTGYFKTGKIRVILVYEDMSIKEHYVKFSKDYVIHLSLIHI